MKPLYTKVYSVVRRDNSIMLYLDRPLGYTISPMSLYEIFFEDHKLIAPIANGNMVKAIKLLIPKNRDTYWVSKLTERNMLRINSIPVATFSHFAPTQSDIFYGVNQGLATFSSYFTNPDYIIPSKQILQVQSLNDCYELPVFSKLMKDNLRIYITGNISSSQKQIIKSDENFKKIIKFGNCMHELSTNHHVYVSTNDEKILKNLQNHKITYTNIPVSL